MSAIKFAVALILAVCVASCGTYVPEIQEFPGNTLSGQALLDSIIFNVTCEVRDAIVQLYVDYPNGTFINNWGAQITLNLQLEEKSSANPTGNWIPPYFPPSSIFNLGVGASGSADATRIDKISWFIAVKNFRPSMPGEPKAPPKAPCGRERPNGVFLMESDLKLKEWIYDAVGAGKTRNIDYSTDTVNGPFKQSVFSHEVKFEVDTSGSITPGWKLTSVSINQTGTGITASRNRTHDLTITFGPADPTATETVFDKNTGKYKTVAVYTPNETAFSAHLASEIGLAVSNGLKSALPSP
jgi:hypothetical protein